MQPERRAFLSDVGTGMIAVSVGPALAADLGAAPVERRETARLTFGAREPLVRLLQETPPGKLLSLLVDRLNKGTRLADLTAAGALANARAFGGEDYVGYHTLMALAPAHAMAGELPAARRALPVLKVLYRNSARLAERGPHADVLTPVEPEKVSGALEVRSRSRSKDMAGAERAFAGLAGGKPVDAFDALLPTMYDNTEVHRVVLAYRAWDLLGLVGAEHAHAMLRQSVRYCVKAENWRRQLKWGDPRVILPRLLEKHKLLGKAPGKRAAEDAWLARLAKTFFEATPEQAAGAAAEALADGMAPDVVGEAISLAACELVLRDAGRPKAQASAGKPEGSIHGDSIGVHASDSANAWRGIARACSWRNAAAGLVLGAFQVALDRVERGGDFQRWTPYPRPEHLARLKATDAAGLLAAVEDAIRSKDQATAAAAVDRLRGKAEARALFDLLLRYAVSEDGALHAEKYYRTVAEEYARTRPAFRWRHLVALARVTASACGQPAPGHQEACKLLKA